MKSVSFKYRLLYILLIGLLSVSACSPKPSPRDRRDAVTEADNDIIAPNTEDTIYRGPRLKARRLPQLAIDEVLVPKEFELVGDGHTDNTRELQRYLDWCLSNNKPMTLPPGDFVFDGLVVEAKGRANVNLLIKGSGPTTKLLPTGKRQYALRLIGRTIQLRDFEVHGKLIADQREASGIYMSNNFNSSGAENVKVHGFKNGVAFHLGTPNWSVQLNNCTFRESRVALKIGGDRDVVPVSRKLDAGGSGNHLSFWSCSFSASDTAIVMGHDALVEQQIGKRNRFEAISFFGCNISATNRILFARGVEDNLTLTECYFERSKKHEPLRRIPFVYFEVEDSKHFSVVGGHMNSTCQKVMVANGCNNLTFDRVYNSGNLIGEERGSTYFDLADVRRVSVMNTDINIKGDALLFDVSQKGRFPGRKQAILDEGLTEILIIGSRIRALNDQPWRLQTRDPKQITVTHVGEDAFGLLDKLPLATPRQVCALNVLK